jgi:hypothetical protein
MSMGLKRHSRGILLQAKGNCSDRVHSDQMVLRTVKWQAGPKERRPKDTQGELSGDRQKKVRLLFFLSKKKKGHEVEDEDCDDGVRTGVSQDRVTATLCSEDLFLCAQYM